MSDDILDNEQALRQHYAKTVERYDRAKPAAEEEDKPAEGEKLR